jgi:hypothetical protein
VFFSSCTQTEESKMSAKTVLISTTFALMASTAMAQSSKEDIIEQLTQQGLTRIDVSRTLFGETRIEATGQGVEREAVLGKEGTVMRDRSERDDKHDDENDENDENDHGGGGGGNNGIGGNSRSGGGDGEGDSDGDSEGDD